MNLNIDISPQEEARFTALARQQGLDAATLARKLVTGILTPVANVAPIIDDENAAAIALLDSWIAAAPTDPDEIRIAEEERNEFIRNLNKNRIESGEKPLFS